jgi:hypothetical protein
VASGAAQSLTLEVDRGDPARRRFVEDPLPAQLADGDALLAVDRFALTANNMTYHRFGDSFGYWRFFPTDDPAWGRIPAMGYADVVASAHPSVEVGERVWGFFPMGTHLRITVGKVFAGGFSDVSPHRDGLAPIYCQFQRAARNPIHAREREEQDCLLRGLFLTSWLCEDALHDSDYHSAGDCLITSASSKTAIALAFCLRERGALRSIALTSRRNEPFCRALGCYDAVCVYDDISSLATDRGALLVDMAGDGRLNADIHRLYGERLRYDCRIGMTHHDAAPPPASDLPGPEPVVFFAPAQAKARGSEWGPEVLEQRIGSAFVRFREFADQWLDIRRFNGPAAVDRAFGEVWEGRAPPEAGYSLSLTSPGN